MSVGWGCLLSGLAFVLTLFILPIRVSAGLPVELCLVLVLSKGFALLHAQLGWARHRCSG